VSLERSVASVPPPRPGLIILAVLLYGGLLLLGSKLGVSIQALGLFAGLWPPTCILLGKLLR
jgi:hypothetical protein